MKNDSHSIFSLILININIMVGAGIFIYPSVIASYSYSLGFLSFGALFILMIPIVLSVAQIAAIIPPSAGGIYSYCLKALGKKIALFTLTTYFLAKTISATIMLQAAVSYLYSITPRLHLIPPLFTQTTLIFILSLFTLTGTKTTKKLQALFVTLKITPILLTIIGGFFILKKANLTILPPSLPSFVNSFPFAFYSMMGFEICSSIGHTSNARSIARAIMTSFMITTTIYMFFQFFLFASLGKSIIGSDAPLDLFFNLLFKNGHSQTLLSTIPVIMIIISALSATYGVLYSNSWNALTILQELKKNYIQPLKYMTKTRAPLGSLTLQIVGILTLTILPLSNTILGKMAVLGVVLVYLSISIALLILHKTKKEILLPKWVTYASIASCFILAYLCTKDLI